ncbi:ATP-dependent DNA helicase [Hominiventricola aquisgranensis]|uniref:ATP-dependent DNA helicase n=1 Tax=Hominiventricola aquisgranensis TaxID=3133164 RepID=A0ABV1HYN7_9FIRM
MRTTQRISVRDLVEFLLRSGDLDRRQSSGRRDAQAMQAGSRIHRKLQKQMGSDYQAEVTLKYQILLEDIPVSVEGRADGIWTDKRGEEPLIVIDEIKGTYRDLSRMEAPVEVHLAQAKCYAYIYGQQRGQMRMGVRMIYADLETEELRYFEETYTMEELSGWFRDLMAEYGKWVSFESLWQERRAESLKKLIFPFDYREGQKDLAVSVYRTIARKKRLFIQAPTGVGKTLSVLFPALKAMGEGLASRIFYLTARTITRTVAVDALDLLRQQGMELKTVVLTAKEKLCVCEKPECDPDHCPRAKGHFDRINQAVYELWTTGPDACTREVILESAERYKVCPFELSLDLAVWVDTLICDYNYVFDPNVSLKRFFADGVREDYLFLIDEAHNLVERGREMYSVSLEKEAFLQMKRLLRGKREGLTKALDGCNRYLLTLKRECESGFQILPQVGGFELQLQRLSAELDKYLEQPVPEEIREQVMEFYFSVWNFLGICDRLDDNYVIYTDFSEEGHFWLHLFCVRPAENLCQCLDCGTATIFFSATLLPVNYYKDLLTGNLEDYAVYAKSPFDPANRLLLVGTDVSSRYSRRGAPEYERMARYIHETVTVKTGNYLVFAPSYQVMEQVADRCVAYEDMECIRQESGMAEEEREAFLKEFEKERNHSLVGFCVMGGIFSEGIDLTEDRLIGALIIGTGLPQVCREREIVKEYFDKKGMDGFAYAYQYPGMNKVLQAAGRVIRTEADRGMILLMDDRFATISYQRLFPREWEQHAYCQVDSLAGQLQEFWLKY